MCNGVVQGIVFCGEEHGELRYVYTRISSFLSWVQTTMSQYKWRGSAQVPPGMDPSIFPGMGALGKVGEGKLPGINKLSSLEQKSLIPLCLPKHIC